MVDQLASMILISVFLTFLGFLSASLLIRFGHIKHPKSRFFIYMIVVLTSLSIILVPILSENLFSTPDATNIDNNYSEIQSPPVSFTIDYGYEEYGFQSSLGNLINGTTESSSHIGEINDTPLEPSIAPSLQKVVCVAILYEKFFKNNKNNTLDNFLSRYNLHLNEEKIRISSVSSILNEIISLNTKTSLTNLTSNTITCKFVLNTELDQSSYPTSVTVNDDPKNSIIVPISFVFLILLICGLVYFFFSLFLGKRITLKSLDAKRCTDKKILSVIQNISSILGIRMPRVFIAKGIPNAFVFGYPTTIVLSQTLLRILTDKELEMTIRHELSHIKNKDVVIKPALQMLRIFLVYNPFIHLTISQMIKERETMADLTSFTEKKDKITFIEALIKIEEYMIHLPSTYRSQSPRSSLSLLNHTKKHIGLEERFTRLFEEEHPKQILSILIGLLLLLTNLSLFAAGFQATSLKYEIPKPIFSENCTMKNESYIYECTFIIGYEDITCQEIVIYKSNINRGRWVQYQTEIIPYSLASYLMKNPALQLCPQQSINNRIDLSF